MSPYRRSTVSWVEMMVKTSLSMCSRTVRSGRSGTDSRMIRSGSARVRRLPGSRGVGIPVEGTAEAGEFPQDPVGSTAEVGEFIGAARAGLVYEAAVGEFGEACAEQVGGDAEAFVQFLVARWAGVEIAQDEQRPAIADGVERPGDRAQQVVVAFGCHVTSSPDCTCKLPVRVVTLDSQVTHSGVPEKHERNQQ